MKNWIGNRKWQMLLFIMLNLAIGFSVSAETIKEFYQQGQEAYNQGEFQKAIDLFEKAVEIDSNFAPAYNALGLAHKEINTDLFELVWLFKTATEIDPNYAEAYDNLGKAYYGLGQFDKAEESCLKALSLSPNMMSSKLSLGWIYLLGKSNPPEAINYFKQVLGKNKIAYAYYGLGIAYFMNGDKINVLETITTLRAMGKEDLALHLETIMREGKYLGQEKGTPLVNTQPRTAPPAVEGNSTLVPGAASGDSTASKDQQSPSASLMRVRLRGKMVNMPSEESVNTSTSSGEKPLGTIENSSDSAERIKKLQSQTLPKVY